MIRRPPRSTLFPYTTLFRSRRQGFPAGKVPGCIRRAEHKLGELPAVGRGIWGCCSIGPRDRKSTRLNSSHANISYAVFCLKKLEDYRNAPCLEAHPSESQYF